MSDVERLAIAARALVVDDDPVARVMAGRCLAHIGFEVSEARNGWEALASAEQKQPDLVLLDVEMPGLDGFDTCKELRRRYPSREVSILIVTGHTDQKTIDRAFEAGGDGLREQAARLAFAAAPRAIPDARPPRDKESAIDARPSAEESGWTRPRAASRAPRKLGVDAR